MKLIRKATSETVPLEDGFLWSDEFDWKPIEQKQERAINGALIIQEGKKLTGRPITLVPPVQGMGWIKRSSLQKILEWASTQEQFTLRFEWPHDQRQFNVIFNHEAGAIEAKPTKEHPTVSEDDYYIVTMRFTEVSDGD
ncbi:hypothetical protein HYG93_05705 [Acinetobacter sp. SwsAc6]|uniref:hypothetical protein n=1 Tax=Acinetobacter sp. SwsAc6 TaxID=2749439 RepID=UPI0015BBFFF7|nr:hypothetical protein [Acinetobacter sp. SwsAc6]NWK73793.1 hypothetical protein [Acinetobacter sp. SwsAc6]